MCGEKDALEIDVEHGVEIVFGDVPESRVFFDPGVVHQYVESAEGFGRLSHQVPHLTYGPEVGANNRSVSTERFHFLKRLFGAARVAVVIDHNVRAFLGEANGDAAADTFAAARDQGLSAKQPVADGGGRCAER